jgi:hypothetical protein
VNLLKGTLAKSEEFVVFIVHIIIFLSKYLQSFAKFMQMFTFSPAYISAFPLVKTAKISENMEGF